jgi:type II secretion system protein J
MNNKSNKNGFTLLELLVAMAIIVLIVSMVYGSYFATSKSTQAYKARLANSQQGRKLLEQVARQIRCSYANDTGNTTYPVKYSGRDAKTAPEVPVNYFSCDPKNPSGEILQLVTTSSFWAGHNPADGLFEVKYKFDKGNRLLFLSQRRFVGVPQKTHEMIVWQQVARNVESFGLAFFDERQWLKNWDFNEQKKLPFAVKIDITCVDGNNQQCRYGTVAYVCCRKNQYIDIENTTKAKTAVKKQ